MFDPAVGERDEEKELTLIAHEELTRGDATTFVRTATVVPPHALPLVCHQIGVKGDAVWGCLLGEEGWGEEEEEEEGEGEGEGAVG